MRFNFLTSFYRIQRTVKGFMPHSSGLIFLSLGHIPYLSFFFLPFSFIIPGLLQFVLLYGSRQQFQESEEAINLVWSHWSECW